MIFITTYVLSKVSESSPKIENLEMQNLTIILFILTVFNSFFFIFFNLCWRQVKLIASSFYYFFYSTPLTESHRNILPMQQHYSIRKNVLLLLYSSFIQCPNKGELFWWKIVTYICFSWYACILKYYWQTHTEHTHYHKRMKMGKNKLNNFFFFCTNIKCPANLCKKPS